MTNKKTAFNGILSDKKFIAAVLVLLLCNLAIYKHLLHTDNKNYDAFRSEFPSIIPGWKSTEVKYDPVVIATLDPDKTVWKNYRNESGNAVDLFMACYNSLEKADLSHSPIVCFTGQGWDIQETSVIDVPLGLQGDHIIKVNRILQKKADSVMVTFYWYQAKNMAFSNRGLQKTYLFCQELIGKSGANAFVRLTSMVDSNITIEKTDLLLKGFLKEVYPDMERYYN
jgi:EpsI family protein